MNDASYHSGVDTELSKHGKHYSVLVKDFISAYLKEREDDKPFEVWTSPQSGCCKSAEPWNLASVRQCSLLVGIDMGDFDAMSESEIAAAHPSAYEEYTRDPYYCRYPRAEVFPLPRPSRYQSNAYQ